MDRSGDARLKISYFRGRNQYAIAEIRKFFLEDHEAESQYEFLAGLLQILKKIKDELRKTKYK